ncbi:MAG: hypothetical protein II306_10080 [Clostridia bacterium]|nr:hypothetical protein [Clostridia bacterium]
MIITAILTVMNLIGWSCVGALIGYITVSKHKVTVAPELTAEQMRNVEKEQHLRQNFLTYSGDEQ